MLMTNPRIISINKKGEAVAVPEMPKPVTWNFLKKTFMENLNPLYYTDSDKVAMMDAFKELERETKAMYPKMIDNHFVAKFSEWETARKNFKKVGASIRKNKNVSKLCHYAHHRVNVIIEELYKTDYELENADSGEYLSDLQVLICFYKWLIKKKWQDVQLPLPKHYNDMKQITAYKNGKKIIIRALSSRYSREKPVHFLGEKWINLLEIKIKEPHAQVALAVPDDEQTRIAFMPFSPFILKTGIRIFMVKAPDKVTELKK
jgi:hypothetical protein